MEVNQILNYMSDYGLICIGIIIFLEYLNLPGFPAGVILPLAGMWTVGSIETFISAFLISIGAALVASWILYFIGWYGGDLLINKYTSKFPKQKETIDKQLVYLQEKGTIGVFISKLIPMVRTIISLPAGALKMNFWKYTVSSAIGIAVWNGAFMLTGYYLGEEVLKHII